MLPSDDMLDMENCEWKFLLFQAAILASPCGAVADFSA
jgi:hypothetical protein